MNTHYDVLIVGAGVSGISVACHLTRECPKKQFIILERRQAIGGTWDLFRYPGIRSDSDMMTFGYNFRPWSETSVFADGPSIKNYVNETAREYGVDKKIQFGLKITNAEWSSSTSQWRVTALEEATGEIHIFTCNYLVAATGYYNYDQAYLPEYPGRNDFKGPVIHPQHWPEKLNYKGKKVIVIGSGATATTLVPAMAKETAHITMLQRSPSYYLSIPENDNISKFLSKFMPKRWVYDLGRKRNIFFQRLLYKSSQHVPILFKRFLLSSARKRVGSDFNMNHLTPNYLPWNERLCYVPSGNFFNVLKEGKASIVTGHIERLTENGVLLKSGQELPADIVVSATGLKLSVLDGIEMSIDGKKFQGNEHMLYKGTLVQDVPNFAYLVGYVIQSSWTLKVDLSADYICRLLQEMDRRGAKSVTPCAQPDEMLKEQNILGKLQSGYIKRGDESLPRQGRSPNWHVSHNYEKDIEILIKQPVDDAALKWK
ncbi:NAD(P)/FAD-dependent oxidoreductase [Xenorhabdus sp. 12]|uniref:NAD(P)/FAD-dependent oxidoreductase n=1 Tax=Xenorhabdus santafensis TaxID=2582833 RepID=A0ABU4S527_9GAMM|nr:NAD(P)/FAD-dependent oxidoreductase [Xenorhabdus sp. 12]MDX7986314.1 NAD(P)/FAD-dependent oxidoreductase [Xenorhabdus sp. 12]